LFWFDRKTNHCKESMNAFDGAQTHDWPL